MNIKTDIERFTSPLYLESGRILEPFEIVYESYGELNEKKDNVIVICHALSGSHHAAGWYEGDRKPGWWDGLIGDNKAIDTTKYFVICTNVLGSCFGSTSPLSKMYPSLTEYRLRFPVLSIQDMVKAQRILFDRLGIHSIKAIIGGSMGGMQALAFGVLFPNFAQNIIPMACTWATRANVIAALRVMMEAIRNDPQFKDGYYDPKEIAENGMLGLSIARMVGYLGYLSPEAMDKKFGRNYVVTDGLYELFGRFEVERYLQYNGYNFPKWFDPLSYLYLIKAISIFDISSGFDTLDEALARIKSKLYLFSFSGDTLFFPNEMKEIADRMTKMGKNNCEYIEIDSNYGHDAFLVEIDKFEKYIREILL